MKKLIYLSILFTILLIPGINVKAANYNFSVNGYEILQGDNGVSWNTNITSVNSSIGTAGQITWDQNWTNGIKVYGIEGMPAGDNYTLTYQFIVNYGSVPDVYGDVSVFVGNGTTGQYACNVEMLSSNFGFSGTSLYSPIYYAECSHVYMQNSGNYLRIYVGQMTGSPRSVTLPRRVNVFKDTSESIVDNNNSNTQNIIDNQSQNTQDVIDNQNSNTQQQIESQKVCNIIDNSKVAQEYKYLNSTGQITSSQSKWGVTDYINVFGSDVKTLVSQPGDNTHYCFYNSNKTLIECRRNLTLTQNQLISLPVNTYYMRFSILIDNNQPQLEVCKSGNQALSDNINGLNDTLNSEATPNTNQDIEDMEDMTASDTPISDLITMPLTLIHAYINGINSTCSPVNLGSLYGTNLTIPCLNLQQRFGSNLWSIIDVLFSIFMCYNIGMLFITAFSGITSLRDDFDNLYVPKHADAGYQPKHGGGS